MKFGLNLKVLFLQVGKFHSAKLIEFYFKLKHVAQSSLKHMLLQIKCRL